MLWKHKFKLTHRHKYIMQTFTHLPETDSQQHTSCRLLILPYTYQLQLFLYIFLSFLVFNNQLQQMVLCFLWRCFCCRHRCCGTIWYMSHLDKQTHTISFCIRCRTSIPSSAAYTTYMLWKWLCFTKKQKTKRNIPTKT